MRLHVLFISRKKWWCFAFSFHSILCRKGEKFAEVYPSSHIWFLFLFTFNDAIERTRQKISDGIYENGSSALLFLMEFIFINIDIRICKPLSPYICYNHVCSCVYQFQAGRALQMRIFTSASSEIIIEEEEYGKESDIKPLKSKINRPQLETIACWRTDSFPIHHWLTFYLGAKINLQMMTKAFAESNCLNPYD